MGTLGYLQKLGKALMLPIAVLPVAALLLRLGQPDLLDIRFMASAGQAIFSNLPLLFAMGIAAGISEDGASAAAMAGAVGYFILTQAAGTIDASINMSFFGGIISGIVAGHIYNRFHNTSLPDFLGFFSGKRLVPIMTGLATLLLAWVFGYVWPSIQSGIDSFGHNVANSGALGQFVYGVLNRAFIPFGLHHVLSSYFWFGLGSFTSSGGDIVTGDLSRFFAGDPTAGVFMTGFFPIMMFGLPGAALAMFIAAEKEQRPKVAGLLFSVALTAFLTGITEPIEFMFMFTAPVLYGVHAVLTGTAMALTAHLGILNGFGFSAGLFDLVLNWGLATRPFELLVVGIGYGAVYFALFYICIRIFNLKTLGRGLNQGNPDFCERADEISKESLAMEYVKALGGFSNIASIDACITRLRLGVGDMAMINEKELKALGASGVVRIGEKSLQVILGPQAEIIAGEMKAKWLNS